MVSGDMNTATRHKFSFVRLLMFSFCSLTAARSQQAGETDQAACKPGSVSAAAAPEDGHSSGTPVAGRLARPTRTTGPETRLPRLTGLSSLLGLAPGGVCRAVAVAGDAVRSYRTLSP